MVKMSVSENYSVDDPAMTPCNIDELSAFSPRVKDEAMPGLIVSIKVAVSPEYALDRDNEYTHSLHPSEPHEKADASSPMRRVSVMASRDCAPEM